MSKVIANKILNAHGLDFVRYDRTGVSFTPSACFKCSTGKRVKGIYCGKTGPLTVTDAVEQTGRATLRDLVMDLQNAVKKVTDTKFIVDETSRSITYLDLSIEQYPAYQHSEGLDESYMGHYVVPVYSTEKK
jgi:hypothetical protein